MREGDYAKWVSEFDDYGNDISCEFYGIDDQSVLNKEYTDKYISEFDEKNRLTHKTYYDAQNKMYFEKFYDSNGNEISSKLY